MGVEVEVGFGIPPTDPKATLTDQIYDNLLLFKDDDETLASVYIAYNKPPQTVRQLLNSYDAIVTIHDPTSDDVKTIDDLNFHNAIYPVRVYAIDKTGLTAKKIVWKLVNAISLTIISTAANPGGVVKHWNVTEGQSPEDRDNVRPVMLCRRVNVKMLFVEQLAVEE